MSQNCFCKNRARFYIYAPFVQYEFYNELIKNSSSSGDKKCLPSLKFKSNEDYMNYMRGLNIYDYNKNLIDNN